MFLKIATQAFEAGDFYSIFLMFLGFWGSFSNKHFAIKTHVFLNHFAVSIYDPPRIQTYFMKFLIKYINNITTTSLSLILFSNSSWYFCKNDSKISSMISSVSYHHNFYIIAFRIYSTSFIKILRRTKINCNCWLNFPFAFSFMFFYQIIQIWFIKILFNW